MPGGGKEDSGAHVLWDTTSRGVCCGPWRCQPAHRDNSSQRIVLSAGQWPCTSGGGGAEAVAQSVCRHSADASSFSTIRGVTWREY